MARRAAARLLPLRLASNRRAQGAAVLGSVRHVVEDAVAHLGVTVRVPVAPAYLHDLLAQARAAAR